MTNELAQKELEEIIRQRPKSFMGYFAFVDKVTDTVLPIIWSMN